jgi:membrane-associated phospholipid phosphatase
MTRREHFFAWPGWPHLRFAAMVGTAFCAGWSVVYNGAGALAEARPVRIPVHFAWERGIPLVGAMFPIYLSINLLLWLAPFVLRTRSELLSFIRTLGAITLVAAAVFVALPAQSAYPDPGSIGAWSAWRDLAGRVALRVNMLPSLHVAMTTACVAVCVPRSRGWQRAVVLTWGGLIVLSTVLTHQHHVLDVVTGAALGWAGVRLVFLRRFTGEEATAVRGRTVAAPVLQESTR